MAWSNRNNDRWQAGVTLTKVSETDTSITLKYTALFRSNSRISLMSSIKWDMSMSGAYSWSYSSGGEAENRWIESENDASVTLGTKEFTVNKTTSSQTVTAVNTVKVTSVSTGTQTASASYTIPAKTSYTVTYNANGGNLGSVPSTQTKWHGTNINVPSAKPTRSGYTFLGWSVPTRTDVDEKYHTEVYYSPNGTIEHNGNQTLKAVWSENILTINYYSNYADYGTYQGKALSVSASTSVIVDTQKYLYDNSYINGLSNVQNTEYLYLARIGYTPTGYWGTSTSGGTLIDQNTSFSTGQELAKALGKDISSGNASIDIYVQWKINTYKFNYNSNGGYGIMSSQNVNWQETFTISNNTFKREGYKFVGWNVRRNSDNTWYVPLQGWLIENEILANGYSKQLYPNQRELTFDNSWVRGNEYSISEYTLYAIWEISGVVYIDNGISFEPYLTYIDNGTGWDLYLVYVDDGETWNIIS